MNNVLKSLRRKAWGFFIWGNALAKRFMLWWTAAVCLFVALGITIHLYKVQYVFNFNILDFLTAVGTVGAVIVALFRDWISRTLFSPKISLELMSKNPVLTHRYLEYIKYNRIHISDSWYFHIKILNKRRWSVADNCYIGLSEVEYKDELFDSFVGDEALNWRNSVNNGEKIECLRVGPDRTSDLIEVMQQHKIKVPDQDLWVDCDMKCINIPTQHKISMPDGNRSKKFNMILIGRSDYVDSEPIKVSVDWDGCFSQSWLEMKKHITIKQLP